MYHFTSREQLLLIHKDQKILKGDVPLTPQGGYNAPWLTVDGEWGNQGWAKSVLDKRAVRLTVQVPPDHPLLHHWHDICREHKVDDFWRQALAKIDGVPMEDVNWYVFHGAIPWSWVITVDFRGEPRGCWGVGLSQSEVNTQ